MLLAPVVWSAAATSLPAVCVLLAASVVVMTVLDKVVVEVGGCSVCAVGGCSDAGRHCWQERVEVESIVVVCE